MQQEKFACSSIVDVVNRSLVEYSKSSDIESSSETFRRDGAARDDRYQRRIGKHRHKAVSQFGVEVNAEGRNFAVGSRPPVFCLLCRRPAGYSDFKDFAAIDIDGSASIHADDDKLSLRCFGH
jgi:hypothetical protein